MAARVRVCCEDRNTDILPSWEVRGITGKPVTLINIIDTINDSFPSSLPIDHRHEYRWFIWDILEIEIPRLFASRPKSFYICS